MDARNQAALVAKGEITPSELLEAAIERIEQSKSLNAKHDGAPHGDAHGHHAEPDQAAKDNRKAEHGGKP